MTPLRDRNGRRTWSGGAGALAISTHNLPSKEQFQSWRSHMAPLVDVHLPDGKSEGDGFLAEQTGWHLGDILIVQQRAQACSYIRDQAMLRSSPIDHWNVGVMRSGWAWTEANRHVRYFSGLLVILTAGG